MESVISAGVTMVCGITEKVVGYAPFFEETGHFALLLGFPGDARLTALMTDIHRALGITVGASHCEIRLTATGPRVIEIGARVAGDRIPVITKLASGIDLIAAAAAAATGQALRVAPRWHRVAGIRMIYPPHDGVVSRLGTRSHGLGSLADLGWYAALGQRVALPPRGFLARLGYLVAVGDTREEVASRLDQGEASLDIEITPEGAR